MGDVLVVGCGLMGTSIGLALQGGIWEDVLLTDRDEEALSTAVARGAGRRWDQAEKVSLAVVAVPPQAVWPTLRELEGRNVAVTYTHIASVQTHVQAEVEAFSRNPSRVVGGHPLAGRELSGPHAALADLFVGRPWAVCPSSSNAEDAVEAVLTLAYECGATPLRIAARDHDQAVALSSHLPQVAASALASVLADPDLAAVDLTLAGPGLADTTRLAASDPALWVDILVANAEQVSGPVRALGERVLEVASALEELAAGLGEDLVVARARLLSVLERGNRGRRRVPVKRGEGSGAFVGIRVSVADEPGQLAALLATAGRAELNVEDVRVEHIPGRPRGVIELMVSPDSERPMRTALESDAWEVL